MNSIFSPSGAQVIDAVARDRALLAFDFDGTLAPIVADRDRAAMRSSTCELLRATALLYPTAVVSGRSRIDVARRVESIPLISIIGNHGAEPGFGPLDRRLRETVNGWVRKAMAALAGEPGVEIEDKRFTVAVHYRAAPFRDVALRRIEAVASRLKQVRLVRGHQVVNIAPEGAPTKGTAVRDLLKRLDRRTVVFVGDDRTDEDAFRSDVVKVGIRVGRCRGSAARWYVDDQAQIDDLLRALITARARQDGIGDRWSGFVRAVALSPELPVVPRRVP
jgi:trehalose 6-phosphate phosphatase